MGKNFPIGKKACAHKTSGQSFTMVSHWNFLRKLRALGTGRHPGVSQFATRSPRFEVGGGTQVGRGSAAPAGAGPERCGSLRQRSRPRVNGNGRTAPVLGWSDVSPSDRPADQESVGSSGGRHRLIYRGPATLVAFESALCINKSRTRRPAVVGPAKALPPTRGWRST